MEGSSRAVHPLLLPALLVAAVAGYLIGHHHSSPARPGSAVGATRLISSDGVLLEYAAPWAPATAAVRVPGLSVTRTTALRYGSSSDEGLLSGLLPAGEAAPLPDSFLALLPSTPHVEVIDLITTQAFRYQRLRPRGYGGTLDVYVIPQTGAGSRVLACYAASTGTAAARSCERIVSAVTLTGPSAPSLAPEPAYAAKLASALQTLEGVRTRSRAAISHSSSPAQIATPASELATGFGAAAAAVAALEAPTVAALAQSALERALRGAQTAYAALAAAASTESLTAYDEARAGVGDAEAAVDAALQSYSLLGYAASG